jgi:hypothetical protein
MSSDLANLKAACHARTAASESDRINEGESLWIAGLAVAADVGHVGLSMGNGHSVVVSESSILEVTKDKDLYFVRVKAGTTALVRSEIITTLRDNACACSEASPPSSAAKPGGGSGGRQVIPSIGTVTCFTFNSCSDYIDSKGVSRRVCVPAPICHRNDPAGSA